MRNSISMCQTAAVPFVTLNFQSWLKYPDWWHFLMILVHGPFNFLATVSEAFTKCHVRANVISGVDFFPFLSLDIKKRDRKGGRKEFEIVLIDLHTCSSPSPSPFLFCLLQPWSYKKNHNVVLVLQSTPCMISEPAWQATGDLWSIEQPTNDIICSVQ